MSPRAQITIRREILDELDDHDDSIGVCARASIKIPYGHDWITATLSSPGVWGIERDAGEEYLNEVFSEEREILLGMLASLRDYEVIQP